jgi:hypothetical protein
MSASRSLTTVTSSARLKTLSAAAIPSCRRCDSFCPIGRWRRDVWIFPRRTHSLAHANPRQRSPSASIANRGCRNSPWSVPLPTGLSPCVRRAWRQKFSSVVSWIAPEHDDSLGPADHEGKSHPQQFCGFLEPGEVPSGLDNGLILDSLSKMFTVVNRGRMT